MTLLERFIKYIKIDSMSDEYSSSQPTTEVQFNMARMLVDELKSVGVDDAYYDEKCYVYGHIPASAGYESERAVGFIAHVDTAPDFCGNGVNPRIIPDYDGSDVLLGTEKVLRAAEFPDLSTLVGRTLITTDGTTLLGADDKAGVAEIVDAAERIINSGKPHGKICICFTPDEEVGAGAANFALDKFGADYAYTVDGSTEGEIVCENFNASHAVFEVNGFNVHPGSAKNTMKNASQIAFEINSMLPYGDRPEHTEGYEGFYHLCHMSGNVESAKLEYIVRDHDFAGFTARKNELSHICRLINERYGEGTAMLTQRDQYLNMADIIRRSENEYVVTRAVDAIKSVGLTPITTPIRGGTDGATLTHRGLPCPNLGTGGYAFHGPYEHCTLEGMQLCSDIIVKLSLA